MKEAAGAQQSAISKTKRRESGMERVYLILRSVVLWLASAVHFFTVCPLLVLLAVFRDPRKHDAPQRWFSRNVVRLAGARVEARMAPGYDPKRTSFFVANHVSLFDPFVLYNAVPQYIRGLELESHFRIPAYGWLMKRFGNVPVPDSRKPSDLKRMWRLTRAALDNGVSLVVFPEGKRTLDGSVGAFADGVFRMAHHSGTPIVPVSLVGVFEWDHKGSWLLRPSKIVVHIHDTIETAGMSREEVAAVRERVRAIIAAPVEEHRERRNSKFETRNSVPVNPRS